MLGFLTMYKKVFIGEFINFALGNKKRVEYINRITKRRSDLSKEEVDEIIGLIDKFDNQRKEMAAVHWICNGRLILPEDMGKLDDAVELMDRFGLDYAKFEGPMELINSVPREKVVRVVNSSPDPEDYPELKLDYKASVTYGELAVYYVQDDKRGQMAMREIMNAQEGKDWKGPWCLLRGDGVGGIDPNAFDFWKNRYNKTPKRVAFLNGDLIAFCASDIEDTIRWWDKNDDPSTMIKLEEDYLEFTEGMSLADFSEYFNDELLENNPDYERFKDVVFLEEDESFEAPMYFNEKTKEETNRFWTWLSFRSDDDFFDNDVVTVAMNDDGDVYITNIDEKDGTEKTFHENGVIKEYRKGKHSVEYFLSGKKKREKYLLSYEDEASLVWSEDGIILRYRTNKLDTPDLATTLNTWSKHGIPTIMRNEKLSIDVSEEDRKSIRMADGTYAEWNDRYGIVSVGKLDDNGNVESTWEYDWDTNTTTRYFYNIWGEEFEDEGSTRAITPKDLEYLNSIKNKIMPVVEEELRKAQKLKKKYDQK